MRKWIGVWLVLLVACENEPPAPVQSGSQFFPVAGGLFWTYAVEQTVTTPTSVSSVQFEIRLRVTDSLLNAEGGYSYRVEQARRSRPQDAWINEGSGLIRKNSLEAVQQQKGVSYVKLGFPLFEGRSWNGNALNAEEAEEYRVVSFNEPFETSTGLSFPRTLRVDQAELDDRIVFRDLRHEVYAENVGLVTREVTQLEYYTDPPRLGKEIVKQGLVEKMALIEFGRE
ncbi:MAG: hypothetical protein ACK5U1_11875 [Cyclobacteriaceae bacterium]|jgi:hypothetical protein